MGSMRLVSLLSAVLLLLVAAPAGAQDSEGSEISLANLVAVSSLRCDALRRGKVATRQADIYRTEASHAAGMARINAEQRVSAKESEAGAAFVEAGRLKRRLARMTDGFVSARRLEWYQTVDQARKIRLEDMIKAAQEILEEGCS